MDKKDHTFIVGDVHGCFDEFILLLKKAGFNPKCHRLILVGDLINKGPDSLKVLEWVKKHSVESVIGNHELKFIHQIEQKEELDPSFIKLKDEMGENLDQWIKYFKSWPLFIEEKDFLVVHAGLEPRLHPKFSKKQLLTNIRCWDEKTGQMCPHTEGKPWHEYYHGKKLVVYGHWARQGLSIKNNSIGLDSGCVYGRFLTGVFLPSRTIVQTPSISSV